MTRRYYRNSARFVAVAAALSCALIAPFSPVLAGASPVAAPAVRQHTWTEIGRVVAIGDVHGAHEQVRQLLLGLELIDAKGTWSGGETHLVFVGDLIDRGPGDRQLLDMIRRLQGEAEAGGGRVHVLLGNHDTMNLVYDFRYVSMESYLAFEDLEQPDDRPDAWKAYKRSMRGSALSRDELQADFDKRYPPGYFGRARAFAPGGEYGDWYMEQSGIIKINDVVFVHGGLTEEVAALGLDEINREIFDDLRAYRHHRDRFVEEGGTPRFASFQELMNDAFAIQNTTSDKKLQARIEAGKLRKFLDSLVIVPDGPLWYRGNSLEDERIERGRLEVALELLDARALVVGHTGTRSGRVQARFDAQLYRTDVGLVHKHRPQAVVFEEGQARVFDARDASWVAAVTERANGEGKRQDYPEVSDLFMERFLAKAEVQSVRELGRGGTRPLLLVLDGKELNKRGLFKQVDRQVEVRGADGTALKLTDRHQHEVAAYKVDRMLGLGKVPVTVARSIDEHGAGSLQSWIEGAIDHTRIDPEVLSDDEKTLLRGRMERLRVFDALIGNPDREETDILHRPAQGQIFFVDHSAAFALQHDLDLFLGHKGCFLDPQMERALRALSRDHVDEELGPWLSVEQIRSLLDRRDHLLRRCDRPGNSSRRRDRTSVRPPL
jgi:hypothetical protein